MTEDGATSSVNQKQESRKHSRMPLKLEVELFFSEEEKYHGETVNMSFGGAYIKLEQTKPDLQTPCPCELRLKLGSPQHPITVPIESVITRSDHQSLALQFQTTTIEGYWHFKNLMVYNTGDSELLLEELEEFPGLSINNPRQ